MTDEGDLVLIDGRAALRFERRLRHPVERVWRAISDPVESGQWFVVAMPFDGVGPFEAMGQPGEVLRLTPPTAVEWEWGGERFSVELAPDDGGAGTRLVFVHVFRDHDRRADFASGWHAHLVDRLDAHLAGQPVPEHGFADLAALNDHYAARFGADPEVGRRILADHFGTDDGAGPGR